MTFRDIYDNMTAINSYILQANGTLEAWNATPWAKKLAVKAKRASLSDFDRFKVMVAKKQRSQIVGDKLKSISA